MGSEMDEIGLAKLLNVAFRTRLQIRKGEGEMKDRMQNVEQLWLSIMVKGLCEGAIDT